MIPGDAAHFFETVGYSVSSKSKSVAGNLTLTSPFAHCTWPGTALPHQLILMLDQVSVILITVSSQYLWMVDLGIPVAN